MGYFTRGNLTVIFLLIGWHVVSATNNILAKVVLNKFNYPLTVTLVQFFLTTVFTWPLLICRLVDTSKKNNDKISTRHWLAWLIPLALAKIVTTTSSHWSIAKLSVSYVHTVKASMPIFTVIFLRIIFKKGQSLPIYLSLLPIIGGVGIASGTEESFNLLGFLSALVATCGFTLQHIFNKRFLDATNIHTFKLVLITGQLSLLLFAPIWAVTDLRSLLVFQLIVPKTNPITSKQLFCGRNGNIADGINVGGIKISGVISFGGITSYVDVKNTTDPSNHYYWLEVAGLLLADGTLCFVQNLLAFAFLSKVAPLTYSVANATKRIEIIVISIMILQNHVTWFNVFGMSLAVLGVLLYTYAKHSNNEMKKSQPSSLKTGIPEYLPANGIGGMMPENNNRCSKGSYISENEKEPDCDTSCELLMIYPHCNIEILKGSLANDETLAA